MKLIIIFVALLAGSVSTNTIAFIILAGAIYGNAPLSMSPIYSNNAFQADSGEVADVSISTATFRMYTFKKTYHFNCTYFVKYILTAFV
jgi:hypothetical protein